MKQDIYQDFTDRIIVMLSDPNIGQWERPWFPSGAPINAVSSKPYRGLNALVLGGRAGGNRWATYKQWAALGAQVRKGERSTQGVYWAVFEKDSVIDGVTTTKRIPFVRSFNLFHESQVDGAPPVVERVKLSETERIERLDQLFDGHAKVKAHADKAFYRVEEDQIYMPEFKAFKSAARYYGTLAHEFAHWTGHKSRLSRDLTGRFGSDSYAMEELVAELTAVFVCGAMGIDIGLREDHVPYIASWLKKLTEDNRAVFTAASHAQKAADYLLGIGKGEDEE